MFKNGVFSLLELLHVLLYFFNVTLTVKDNLYYFILLIYLYYYILY